MEPLTPGHFLIGSSMQAVPDANYTDMPDNRLKEYQLVQKHMRNIWSRWYPEYIQQLQARAKYCNGVAKPGCNIAEELDGDASFVDEEEDNADPSVSDSSSDDESKSDEGVIDFKSMNITDCLRYFAIATNQKQSAMNMLLSILITKTNFVLPKDARTLLNTNRDRPELSALGNGTFWTRGIKKSLMDNLRFTTVTETISWNIFIDGLPLHKSSNMQFWPIMINIQEMPLIAPITTALYCGRTKPTNAQQFMDLLVKELNKLMDEGLELNNYRVQVKIRAIIADSPARAFLKASD
ncbi:uncharacterized protein LOC128718301 [Anopheles marshallii]|uniref:uncharacterized protein LOC128718301 n=1 Tax=Anopheles marshallii TaxID=1521116 RepID=UPI00237A42C6|nr:uncharacterized protein LOC128718301 [Anopheles marshallii]